jgi:hypothetical protein
MHTTETFFSNHIYAMAVELRGLAKAKFFEILSENLDEDMCMTKLYDWDKSNSMRTFIAAAFVDAENVNRLLYNISTSDRQK